MWLDHFDLQSKTRNGLKWDNSKLGKVNATLGLIS